jgi:hypothetical protein
MTSPIDSESDAKCENCDRDITYSRKIKPYGSVGIDVKFCSVQCCNDWMTLYEQ